MRGKCPACGEESTVYGSRIINMVLHIRRRAASELFDKEFGEMKKTPHVDYIKKNCKVTLKQPIGITITTK